jgi:hypothetical protein
LAKDNNNNACDGVKKQSKQRKRKKKRCKFTFKKPMTIPLLLGKILRQVTTTAVAAKVELLVPT